MLLDFSDFIVIGLNSLDLVHYFSSHISVQLELHNERYGAVLSALQVIHTARQSNDGGGKLSAKARGKEKAAAAAPTPAAVLAERHVARRSDNGGGKLSVQTRGQKAAAAKQSVPAAVAAPAAAAPVGKSTQLLSK